jgi:GNAT superfamily N-acetyltransferase
MSPITIRTMRGHDISGVLSVWNRALTRDFMSEDRFVRIIMADSDYRPGDDSGFFVAVTRSDQPVGFMRAIIRHWPNDRLGLESEDGWIPYMAVDPSHQRRGIGAALLGAALDYFARHGRQRVWVCGTPTSAPGSTVPGVDVKAYPAALTLFEKAGFVVDQHGFSMARSITDFDDQGYRRSAWRSHPEVEIHPLTPHDVQAFLVFLAESLPGAWAIAGRSKVGSGALHEVLIATWNDRITGYCQWTGEHFGPFGVAPEARNKQVGAKLFTEAIGRIREAGRRRVWFNWADENAKRFYDRFGLHVTRRFAVLRKDLA